MKINRIIIFAVMLLIVSASAFAETFTDSGKLTMSFTLKDFATVTTAPAAVDNLEYNGTSQDLITAGTPNGGTMVYALGTSEAASEDYSVSIPTGFDEGTYYVWYKVSADADHRDSAALSLDVTITLTSYTISYDLNGANEPGNPTSYTMKSSDITLINPAKNGYTFRGWTGTELTELSTNVTIPGGSSGDRSYTANWQKITYKVSFDANGGEFGEGQNNPTSYDVESENFSPIAPTREGYDFEGWLLSGDESGTVSSDLMLPTGTTGDREYIAQWTLHVYTLSYDIQSGTVSPDNPTSYTIESDDIKLYNPTKTGYTFDGWTGTSVDVTSSKDVTISHGSTGDRSYTANWTLNVYTLSYDLDGGTVSPDNPVSYTIESEDFTLTNPIKDGYDFAGWSFDNEISLDVTIPKGTTGDRNFEAQWTLHVYTLSYDLAGGEVSSDNPTSYTVESDDFTLTNPTKTGYDFAGWSFDNEISLDVTISKGSTGNREYTANWTAIVYTISYDLQGGSVTTANPTSYTIESSDITLTNPTRTGYTFAGWTGTGITEASTDVTIPTGSTGNREYTANWTLIQYNISFDLNGGVFVEGNPTTYNYETDTFTLNNPTREGYDFEGWLLSGDESGTVSTDVTLPTGSTGNREYLARWALHVYKLSYDLAGGTVSPDNPTSYTVESDDFTLTNPIKTGYTFEGWTGTSVDIDTSKDVTISAGSTGDREYTANWTLIVYTLSYDLDGGTVLPDNSVSYTIESEDFTLTNPTKVGYDFAGWTGTSVDVITSKDVTIPKGSTGNREYTAKWTIHTYTISYDLQGGSVTTANPTSYTIESEAITLNNPTKDGYTFAGWTGTSVDVTMSKDVTIPAGSIGNRSYTANWTAIGKGSVTPNAVQVSGEELSNMTDEEIVDTIGNKTEVALTGNVENLSETIARLETLTDVKTLDLSQVTGTSELKLEQTTLENITLEGNQSIKTVEITANETLTTLNLAGSKVETVDAKGCENLEEVNLEGCESLEYLDVSETAITELNVQDCVNLGTLYCASCDLEELNIAGCEKLGTLDCSNNSLLVLDASEFKNLRSLECKHQHAFKPLSRLMNFIDLLLGRGSFAVSETNDDSTYLEKVNNLKAYDEVGNELTVKFDTETGEVEFSGEPAKITYDYDTGFENTMMDVEISASESDSEATEELGGYGGCTSGLGTSALALLMLLFVLTSKTKTTK